MPECRVTLTVRLTATMTTRHGETEDDIVDAFWGLGLVEIDDAYEVVTEAKEVEWL